MAGYISEEWLPEEELQKLRLERAVQPDMTDAELAHRILKGAAPMAAQSLAYLSVHAVNEKIRLDASKYLIDGVVAGKFTPQGGGTDDVMMDLLTALQQNDPDRQKIAETPTR